MEKFVVSVITVAFNSVRTIKQTIDSVLDQDYSEIEYIIVDGGSVDGTVDIIKSYEGRISKYISEPDTGMYDALNKGIQMSSGDIVGVLNSDDTFCNTGIVGRIANVFENYCIDSVYGDAQFVDPEDNYRIIRYYSSRYFKPSRFKFGFMPAHPSFYVKRDIFNKFGIYKTSYKIAADFEILLRFMLIHSITTKYLGFPVVSMRMGGISNKSMSSNYLINKEIMRACKENGIQTNYLYIYSKYFFKVLEFVGN